MEPNINDLNKWLAQILNKDTDNKTDSSEQEGMDNSASSKGAKGETKKYAFEKQQK